MNGIKSICNYLLVNYNDIISAHVCQNLSEKQNGYCNDHQDPLYVEDIDYFLKDNIKYFFTKLYNIIQKRDNIIKYTDTKLQFLNNIIGNKKLDIDIDNSIISKLITFEHMFFFVSQNMTILLRSPNLLRILFNTLNHIKSTYINTDRDLSDTFFNIEYYKNLLFKDFKFGKYYDINWKIKTYYCMYEIEDNKICQEYSNKGNSYCDMHQIRHNDYNQKNINDKQKIYIVKEVKEYLALVEKGINKLEKEKIVVNLFDFLAKNLHFLAHHSKFFQTVMLKLKEFEDDKTLNLFDSKKYYNIFTNHYDELDKKYNIVFIGESYYSNIYNYINNKYIINIV